ncbi:MAG: hypothetical protein JWR27_2817 [Aeromicrobium sp.]|jgi:4-amino-4-deoxy-L-arabinose transferase-like glycosyltransferase|nr:hypothetical protein [Aeromicrobium sp.]
MTLKLAGSSFGVRASVVAVLAVMIAVRLAFLGLPSGRDEAGFLIVGDAWGHGPALYGDYWVDRPPLLVAIMDFAGSVTALRLLGLLASVLMVLGVCRAAYVARGPGAARWAAGTAALMATAPWFGIVRTNGEMLASPFVAWGFALTLQALLRPGPRSRWLALAAGVLAACAGLIKQTIADGLVLAVVLGIAIVWQQRSRRREVGGVLAAGAVGFVVTLAVALVAAATRGTSAPELFDALVTFRAEAGEVIRRSASGATAHRLWVLAATWAGSGLAVITVLAGWHAVRRREPVMIATFGVLVLVTGTAILGGSYWGHYLLQLVPAAALATGLLADRVAPPVRAVLATLVVAATLGNLAWNVVAPPHEGRTAEVVGTWLRHTGHPGDTAVIAYGQPNVLGNAGMSSPYPYLWSLPVRTLDPDLAELAAVLDGPDRPTWVVDWSGIRSWGIDPVRLTGALGRHYRHVAEICGRSVWLDATARRTLSTPAACP